MQFPNLASFLADARKHMSGGPVALVIAEDSVELAGTVTHLTKLGFTDVVIFSGEPVDPAAAPKGVTQVTFDTSEDGALQKIINGTIKALPGTWLFYCYNGEYLHYPFCETRNVVEMLTFMTEERRDSVMGYVIDLYARDLEADPDGVNPGDAWFDKSGYYALALRDSAGEPLDRQIAVAGGLRWRFEEHIPPHRQRTDRVSFIRAVPGLEMQADRSFNIPEFNTYACPWHNNLTVAIPSFRTAKALRRNPGSRDAISAFHWSQSERFAWTSHQLLDLGLMEPGQWF
ncbi:hypothetical protein [Yoonia litorea]|uniref:Glycosyl transferase family 2 n=1 Tax=Yoonia litorea TaxID=1123755 RepID=A0A1I6LEH7_9RHOB|nr:hypothetical protein [Yoonia litorea]SFS01852.1 hypothetical protein SAMN05444714_0460 [Yoonia litorea]